MKTLQEATEKICELKGESLAKDAFIAALIRVLPADISRTLRTVYEHECEAIQASLLPASISEQTIAAFDRDAQKLLTKLGG